MPCGTPLEPWMAPLYRLKVTSAGTCGFVVRGRCMKVVVEYDPYHLRAKQRGRSAGICDRCGKSPVSRGKVETPSWAFRSS